ncbi:MAG: Hsp20/alpha crystallin family protein [Selenomonas sp.]|uniref:Hsp20/alpha crystallin family protein n=1 Tax=Selenomonas sp. TaxID=2053611 RepID=UPI0025D085ED|nr:Hsp20/alpha crystallin family protein [Selenomonas sp.]MCR5438588.1 Hsp20/alpha crystallin family protein [Selenomonas sp.]
MFGLVPFGARNNLAKSSERPQSIWDVFDEPFFKDDFFPAMDRWNGAGGMRVDVKDNGNSYELTADLPGMAKEDIHLSYQNSYLTISAQKDESKEEKDEAGNYIRRERRSGSMSRSFYIDNIDENRVTAEFKDGVLHVNMPKAAEVQHSTEIEIK